MSSGCSSPLELPELLDYILGFLSGNTAVLISSSLVSKAWSTSAARHLFMHLTIHPLASRPALITNNDGNNPITNNLSGAEDFESSYSWLVTRPRIADNVRSVYVAGRPIFSSTTLDPLRLPHEHIYPALIIDIMASFPQLRKLKISHDMYSSPSSGPSTYSLHTPPSRLHLDTVELQCFTRRHDRSHLQSLLTHIDELDSLILRDRLWGEWSQCPASDNVASESSASRTKLRSFTFANSNMMTFAFASRSLASLFEVSCVTSIIFSEYWPNASTAAFTTFVRDHTPQVEYFALSLTSVMIPNLSANNKEVDQQVVAGLQFDLSCLTALRRVHFGIVIRTWPRAENLGYWQHEWLWTSSMSVFLTAPPRSLSYISIGLSFLIEHVEPSLPRHALAALDWSVLHRIIERQPSLHTVDIQFPHSPHFSLEAAEGVVRDRLSGHVSQILTFSQSSELSFTVR